MRAALRTARTLTHKNDGFTIVEVMVSILLLTVGILATVGVLDGSRDLTALAEKEEIASQRGEREIERILALPYEQIALTSTPVHSPNADNPNFYVPGGHLFQWDRKDTTKTETFCAPNTPAPASCPAGAAVSCPSRQFVCPGGEDWDDESLSGQPRVRGKLFRYVTWSDDPCGNCPTTTDYKRVTVALTVDGQNAPKTPVLVSTIVTGPTAGPGAP